MAASAFDSHGRAGTPISRKRAKWEQRYLERDTSQFKWFLHDLPPPLAELLQDGEIPDGAALDIGCGLGTITRTLAASFRPVIGFDFAAAAVRQARALRVQPDEPGPLFLIAAAPDMPFRDRAFSFILDRGCMHTLPTGEWPRYFERVERMLSPAGLFQLYVSEAEPPGLSLRGLRGLTSALKHRHESVADRVNRCKPPSLELLDIRPYRWAGTARRRQQACFLFRKRD